MSDQTISTPYQYYFPLAVDGGKEGAVALKWPPGKQPFDRSERETPVNSALPAAQTQVDAFSAEECKAIITLGERRAPVDGTTSHARADYRVSKIAWIESSEDAQWLYHRLGILVNRANRHYGFELVGFAEALQYTTYGPGHHFEWHMDLGAGMASARKLSLTLQLSDTDEYEGGDLEFFPNTGELEARRPLGSVTFFPSYLTHRVTPVTRGLRRSLVAWAYGPGFR